MEKKTNELDKLFEEVGTYRKSEDYKKLLDFIKKFRGLSPYNAMLVDMQKPGSIFVTTASDWRYRFGRKPKIGARPLVILRPFGPVYPVYELGDTEGKEFPKEAANPFHAYGDVSDLKMEKLRKSMYFEGVKLSEQDYAAGVAGGIKALHEIGEYKSKKTVKQFRIIFGMALNRNLSNVEKAATIFHELGHVFCGHMLHTEAKWLPERHNLSMESKEFEAESVCWLVCERNGIKNPSAEYLAELLDSNNEIPPVSIEAVMKAAGTVEKIWEGSITAPRKELLLTNAN